MNENKKHCNELRLCHKLKSLNPSIFATADNVNLWYFKLRLSDLTELIVLNI